MTTSISSEAQKFVAKTDRHCCFLQTTGNLIFNQIINTKDMGENVKNIKIAKNLKKRESDHQCVFFKRQEFNFDIID